MSWEKSVRGETHDGLGGDGPALQVDFTANLVVHQLHLFAALQGLEMSLFIIFISQSVASYEWIFTDLFLLVIITCH